MTLRWNGSMCSMIDYECDGCMFDLKIQVLLTGHKPYFLNDISIWCLESFTKWSRVQLDEWNIWVT